MNRPNLSENPMRFVLIMAAFAASCIVWHGRCAWAQTSAPATRAASLKEIYRNDFLIGTAIDIPVNPLPPEELEILKTQFNIITPENSMKPQSVHPAEDRWTFDTADRLVKFCEANGIQVWGHTLIWHAQTAGWFFEGENGQPVTREKALERMKKHITEEVSRYKGKLKGWDVVNEAINDGGPADTENLRNSPWLRAVGPDYINYAFKFAHEADPSAELNYNDYNIEKGNKHQNSLLLLKRLLKEGVPVSGVGIQGHWGLNNLPYEQLDQAIADYEALGLKVSISELDITITGQGGGQLTPNSAAPATAPAALARGAGPGATSLPGAATAPGRGRAGGRGAGRGPTAPPTQEQLEAQAAAYAKFFEIFLKHKDAVDRVTFWGLNDARSWRRGQAPLLYDAQNKPKPAMAAVIAAKK